MDALIIILSISMLCLLFSVFTKLYIRTITLKHQQTKPDIGYLIYFEDTEEIYVQLSEENIDNIKTLLINNVNNSVSLTVKLVRTKKTNHIMKK